MKEYQNKTDQSSKENIDIQKIKETVDKLNDLLIKVQKKGFVTDIRTNSCATAIDIPPLQVIILKIIVC